MPNFDNKSGPILAVNSGSSSLKFGVFRKDPDKNDEVALLTGAADGIGKGNGDLKISTGDGSVVLDREIAVQSQTEIFALVARTIEKQVQQSLAAVGHRIVHGGSRLLRHQLITPQVLDELRAATHFAPLHIPEALELIEVAQQTFGKAAHFACFDDAFHRTIPEIASHFALPQKYFDKGIRRYGFHGISYESLIHHFGPALPSRAIFAHLGNGASLCAIRDGKSIDTTMGLTPTGGIPMGTRSGDLDPGVLVYLLRNEKLNADGLEQMLNHESGLFGLSSGESDVRALEQRANSNDVQAQLALEIFAVSVRKTIGAYIALLGGIDLLVFTGGIGEHSVRIRNASTQALESLGLTPNKIQVVRAEEEVQIARHCRELMSQLELSGTGS